MAITAPPSARQSITRPGAQKAPSIEQQTAALCGSCHDVPPPAILPRAAWRGSFERMAMIRKGEPQISEVRSLPGSVALPEDMERVLRYYEQSAQERLPPPERWPAADPSAFVRRAMAPDLRGIAPTIASVRQTLDEGGAMDYTTIVASPASDPAGFKWLAPYTGSAIGQNWMYDGKHVLIVFDDLSKQAEAYRAISLLLRRPPGREAYPGDVFYLHSRLLERCAKLSDELGGGSLTGLPIIETKANDISAYIPTNVISITDGQCFLETDLFNQGVRPAINVGASVSRVGGAAQIKAMKEVAGSLRLDLSQYRELESFAAFASDLDETSKNQLDRGERLVELLKQPQNSPMPIEEQVVAIFLGTRGHLDSVPVEDVQKFEREFLEHVKGSQESILKEIRESKKFSEELEEKLEKVVNDFKKGFDTTDGSSVVPDEHVDAMDDEDVEKESVKVKKPKPKKK